MRRCEVSVFHAAHVCVALESRLADPMPVIPTDPQPAALVASGLERRAERWRASWSQNTLPRPTGGEAVTTRGSPANRRVSLGTRHVPPCFKIACKGRVFSAPGTLPISALLFRTTLQDKIGYSPFYGGRTKSLQKVINSLEIVR